MTLRHAPFHSRSAGFVRPPSCPHPVMAIPWRDPSVVVMYQHPDGWQQAHSIRGKREALLVTEFLGIPLMACRVDDAGRPELMEVDRQALTEALV